MNLTAPHISAILGAHAQGFKAAVLDGIGVVSIEFIRDESDWSNPDEYLYVLLPGDLPLFVDLV